MSNLVLLAALPGFLIMFYVYKMDKIEKEPRKLLWKLFFLGALAIIPAILFEMLGDYLLFGDAFANSLEYGTWSVVIEYFLVVGLFEELFKFIGLKLGSWKNKAFNYSFDGIVYAVVTGMGFAVFENIMYVVQNGIENAIVRALISVPGHGAFAVCMGVFYSEAKKCEKHGDKKGKKANLVRALIYPLLMHGFFDTCLSLESNIALIIFFVYIAVVDIFCVKKIKEHSDEDECILTGEDLWEEACELKAEADEMEAKAAAMEAAAQEMKAKEEAEVLK